MTATIFKKAFVGLVMALLLGVNASAALIYDNSTIDLGARHDPGLNEVGDEIILFGSERYLTEFAFGYWAFSNGGTVNPFSGNPEVRVRFYLNEGPEFNGYATPSDLFYESDWFAIPAPTTRDSLEYSIGAGD